MPIQRSILNPDIAPKPLNLYSNAVRVKATEFLYIAGQLCLDSNGNLVGPDDVAAQIRQVYHNIGLVLQSQGASFDNVLEFTSYLTKKEYLPIFMETRREVFASIYQNGQYPPNTLLVVDGLVLPDCKVEIKAVAALA